MKYLVYRVAASVMGFYAVIKSLDAPTNYPFLAALIGAGIIFAILSIEMRPPND